MIKKPHELKNEVREAMMNGKGSVQITHLLQGEEFANKGRLYARMTLKPGCSVGNHQHQGDFEAYYILAGKGVVDDNGILKPVATGDLVYTKNGEAHSIENTGTVDLEFMALILFD
ncbi:cupin domain-containing protein [Alkaliphilus crotonatoxidans]